MMSQPLPPHSRPFGHARREGEREGRWVEERKEGKSLQSA